MTIQSQTNNEYRVNVPRAGKIAAASVAVGVGVPFVTRALMHNRLRAADPHVWGMGAALASSSLVLAAVRPSDMGTAMTIGGITGLVTGTAAGATAMRVLEGSGNRDAMLFGAVIGGMWGGTIGLGAPSFVGSTD